jgi:hypothetical protein
MMHLEFAPKHIHVAFSPLLKKQAKHVALFKDQSKSASESISEASLDANQIQII